MSSGEEFFLKDERKETHKKKKKEKGSETDSAQDHPVMNSDSIEILEL